MKAFKIHMFGWLAMLSLAGVWTASGQPDPAPVAPTNPDNAPGKGPANTVQLHRVIYVHAGDSGNLLQQRKFVDQYAAPPQLFPVDATPDPQYMPPTIQISNEEIARQRHAADNDKNWMLLTPEEILGIKDETKGADDSEQNLSAEDRFLKRLEQSRMTTNNSPAHSSLFENDWRKDSTLDEQFRQGNIWSRSAASYYSRTTPFDPLAPKADSNDTPDHQVNPAGTPSPWASAWAPWP